MSLRRTSAARALLAAALVGLLGGCATLAEREPRFTAAEQARAEPLGLPGVRVWGDATVAELVSFSGRLPQREPRTVLALSGGADDGAFGAGFLVGWSAHGSRPSFDVVTGVSTGALMAPFAFLGPDYDGALEAVYTRVSADDIFGSPSLVGALVGDALADSSPLRRLIATHADEAMLRAIARERRRGRALYVVTTNLDAQRPVLWDLGAIAVAAEADPARALDLFRSVLLASASIPGLLPPVLVEVEAGGRRFQEMHVDGAATTQILTVPESFIVQGAVGRARPGLTLYALVNNRLEPAFEIVPRRTLAIAGKAFSTVLKSFSRASLASAYAFARRNGIAFRLASIGGDFPPPPSGAAPFDTATMRRLFAYGYERGKALGFDPLPDAADRPRSAARGVAQVAGSGP